MLKNVIIVCDYGYIEGGAARIAHETALALKEQGYRVIFFCAVSPVSKDLLAAKIEVVCLEQADILHEKSRVKGVLRGISNKKAKREFSNLLDSLNPAETIIHVHTWTKGVSSSIFPVANKNNFNVVITVHDYFLICPNGGLFNYKKSEICTTKPMSLRCIACNCDARSYPQKLFRVVRQLRQNRNIRSCSNVSYIFISDFSKREFLKRYNNIPIDRQYFLQNMVSFENNRFRIECEKNDTYLFIGGLTEVKGIKQFCEAVTRAGVKAVVIGQGILREELEKKYPAIEFVGWKTMAEMVEYYKTARCLVFPSIWYEASPLTPLEVMAYGIPVICSDLNATTEYIKDKKTGFIYNGDVVDDLFSTIKSTEDNNLIEHISQEIFTNFDVNKFSRCCYVNNLQKIYDNLL